MYSHDNTKTTFRCELCNYTCSKKFNLDKHNNTKKHKNVSGLILSNEKEPNYDCKLCDVKCSHKSIYDRHILSKRHKNTEISTKNSSTPDLISQLLADNSELRRFLIDQSKEHARTLSEQKKETIDIVNKVLEIAKSTTSNNCNNTTNNNQKFNINVFLNEQCKDAINFADFVKNIEVSREDIQNTGQLGFVNGISKIIIYYFNHTAATERPIHCTDLKRETMYIKDEDTWNKEEDDTKLRNAIQTVSRKSVKTLQDWKQVNPDYDDGDSDFSQECLSMQRHSVAGEDREVYYPKVARLVAKEVIIDKA